MANSRFKKPSIMAQILLILQKIYKITLSPLIGRQCRYLPTCSDYAADCVRQYGAWAGSWMSVARLCRCHPWGQSGYDPAPQILPKAKWYSPWQYGIWKIEPNVIKDNKLVCEKLEKNV